jgi:transposase
MRTWPHERLLKRPKGEDSLLGGRRHAESPGVSHLLRESLSSVKRYVDKANRGESLAPKKRPGAAPKLDEKAMRLLAADLEERPYLTLRERCDYIEAMTGLSVSRSTMCRAIARIATTRKKGGESQPSARSS